MRILILCCELLIILIIGEVNSSNVPLMNSVNYEHREANIEDKGFWKKHVEWKARYVKEFAEKRIWVPYWRKVWGPLEIHEWVPLPAGKWKNYQEKHVNLNLT